MWKCPNCGRKNRMDVCTACGTPKTEANDSQMGSARFFIMVLISLLVLAGIFFGVDKAIEYNHRKNADKEIEAALSFEEE